MKKKIINFDTLVDTLHEEANTKYNTYLIVFHDWDEDEIKIRVKQDINRPNNPDDEELISEYVMDNYGYKGFEMIPIDKMETVDI